MAKRKRRPGEQRRRIDEIDDADFVEHYGRDPAPATPAPRVEAAAAASAPRPASRSAARAAVDVPRRIEREERAPLPRPSPPLLLAVLLVIDVLFQMLSLGGSLLTINPIGLLVALVSLSLDVGCWLMQAWAIAVRIALLVLSFAACVLIFVFLPREMLGELGDVGRYLLMILMAAAAWSLLLIVACAQAYGPAAGASRSRRRRIRR